MIDISGLDERTKADEGEWVDMLHPETGDPITGKGKDGKEVTAQMLIFGQAGREVQDKLHEIQKSRAGKKDNEPRTMKRSHDDLVAQAVVYIGGFRNLEANGEDLSDASNARRVLDMTFPRMELIEGSAASINGPQFKMANTPFAVQAINAASKQGEALGNE